MSETLTFPEMLDTLKTISDKAGALGEKVHGLHRDVRQIALDGESQEARDQAAADLVVKVMTEAHDETDEIHGLIHRVLDGGNDEEHYLREHPEKVKPGFHPQP